MCRKYIICKQPLSYVKFVGHILVISSGVLRKFRKEEFLDIVCENEVVVYFWCWPKQANY